MGKAVTVTFKLGQPLKTGTYELEAYIPEHLDTGSYTLSYIGAYNEAGYDAGYNRSGGEMVGYGKCDWLNSFPYGSQAELSITSEGSISAAHAKLMDYEIKIGLRDKRNRNRMRIYPN